MTIGSQIALLRKQQSMTQEMLANKLGVSNQAVSKWEAEQCCPDIQLLPQIADIFEVSIDSLFGRETYVQKEAVSQEVVSKELPWENDNTLRVVAYIGHTLQERQAYDELKNIELIYEGDLLNVDSCISVSCENIEGNVNAGMSVNCGDVEGNVNAGMSVNCGDVEGSVNAGMAVNCGDIEGDVNAGGDVNCGDVEGDVTAGTRVECGDIEGDVEAGTGVSCGDVDGDVNAGGDVYCGDVEGNVDAGGHVECGDVEGDIEAGQYVKSDNN